MHINWVYTDIMGLPINCMISNIRREVDKRCVLLGYYRARSGNFLPTFRDNLSV